MLNVLLLTVIAIAAIALAIPPRVETLPNGSFTKCGIMCNTFRGGGGGSLEADCQDCCDEMGLNQTQCYADCAVFDLPCTCAQ